jgi:energy-converting hydrogenase Eha subunit A
MMAIYFSVALCVSLGAILFCARKAPRGTWKVAMVFFGPVLAILGVVILVILVNKYGIGFHVADVKAGA